MSKSAVLSPVHYFPQSKTLYLTYLLMNRLWKSLRSRSFTNSLLLFLSSVPLAWFLNTTSSSHLLLTVKSIFAPPPLLFSSGFPLAISFSRSSASAAAFSRSSRSRFSCLSRLTRSSSRCSSASSSSLSESLSESSSSSSSFSEDEESESSASMSRVSSIIRRRFASGSSSSSAAVEPASRARLALRLAGVGSELSSSLVLGGRGPPFSLAWCACSAARSSARRSRVSRSAFPPCPGFLRKGVSWERARREGQAVFVHLPELELGVCW